MKSDIERWIQDDGQVFLKEIGIRRGQLILDFGCGDGHYTIPAAKVVGKEGLVYAQDKEEKALDELSKRAEAEGLKNIRKIKTEGELKTGLRNKCLHAVLLYDVLHYHEGNERKTIYREVHRILRNAGLLSVFPRHHNEEMNLNLEEVTEEIEKANFRLEEKSSKRLLHDDSYVTDYILTFRKR
jgi:ubiquinone/menaquinone biosynthesis C-methylase UbiE